MWEILRAIFIVLEISAGIAAAAFTLRKSARYSGNRLLAAAMLLAAGYGVCFLLFALQGEQGAMQWWCAACSYACIFSALLCLYLTMKVIVHGAGYLRSRRVIGPSLLVVAFCTLVFAFPGVISLSSKEGLNLFKIEWYANLVFGSGTVYFIAYSIYAVFVYGIKRAAPARKGNMSLALAGFLVFVGALVLSVASDEVASPILDTVFHLVLACGMGLVSLGLAPVRGSVPAGKKTPAIETPAGESKPPA